MPDFQSFPLTLNAAIFVGVSVVILFAGARASSYADALATRTGLGKAFVGLLLLAVASSLPEIGLSVTASLNNNAELVISAIFGGIVFQTAILTLVDLVIGRGALTYFTPKPVLLLQGVMLILMLATVIAGVAVGERVTLAGVGLWTTLIGYLYLVFLLLSNRYETHERWAPEEALAEREQREQRMHATHPIRDAPGKDPVERSLARIVLLFGGTSLLILIAGVILALTGDAVAAQTGLGATFIGATLVAIATSLPEVSTTISAARLGNYEMAVSNIFGSNSLMLFILFIADIAYRSGPLLNEVKPSALFSAAMGIAVTAVYLVGLIERRDQTMLRMGIDSVIVLILYGMTLAILYTLS